MGTFNSLSNNIKEYLRLFKRLNYTQNRINFIFKRDLFWTWKTKFQKYFYKLALNTIDVSEDLIIRSRKFYFNNNLIDFAKN